MLMFDGCNKINVKDIYYRIDDVSLNNHKIFLLKFLKVRNRIELIDWFKNSWGSPYELWQSAIDNTWGFYMKDPADEEYLGLSYHIWLNNIEQLIAFNLTWG